MTTVASARKGHNVFQENLLFSTIYCVIAAQSRSVRRSSRTGILASWQLDFIIYIAVVESSMIIVSVV